MQIPARVANSVLIGMVITGVTTLLYAAFAPTRDVKGKATQIDLGSGGTLLEAKPLVFGKQLPPLQAEGWLNGEPAKFPGPWKLLIVDVWASW